jgi:hypothetical protein
MLRLAAACPQVLPLICQRPIARKSGDSRITQMQNLANAHGAMPASEEDAAHAAGRDAGAVELGHRHAANRVGGLCVIGC